MWTSPSVPWEKASQRRRELLAKAWFAGEFFYKLDPVQKEDAAAVLRMWAAADSAASRWVYLDWARRSGKDTVMLVLLMRHCIKNPGSFTTYCAPTQKDMSEILEQVVRPIFVDCPPMLEPKWIKSDYRYKFPNGSVISLAGLDLHPNRARGRKMDMWALTEPGFMSDLEYVFGSIVQPQLLTSPHACGIMGSTPAVSPTHPWSSKYRATAQTRGVYIKRTLDDNPRVSPQDKELFLEEVGGPKSVTARREYYCEHIMDTTRAVVPEWVDHGEACVAEVERPKWINATTIADSGFEDLAAALFCYWDFERAALVIEDEWTAHHANTEEIARGLKSKEEALWADLKRYSANGLKPQPFQRFCDSDLRLLADLKAFHGILVSPVLKDDKEAAVNGLRLSVQRQKILINPRCKQLIASMESAIWNKARTSYERHPELGHYDLVDCAVYAVRNVSRRNPYPPPDYALGSDYHIPPDARKAEQEKRLVSLFRGPRRRTG